MDFESENIVEDNYWVFGLFADKNGKIDFGKLKSDLEEFQYYIAAISLETADGIYFARLSQQSGYRWIFENSKDVNDDPSEYFEDFISGEVFKKFSEHAPEIIKRGFDALSQTLQISPEKFEKNGINRDDIENILGISKTIIKRSDNAFEHPILKK